MVVCSCRWHEWSEEYKKKVTPFKHVLIFCVGFQFVKSFSGFCNSRHWYMKMIFFLSQAQVGQGNKRSQKSWDLNVTLTFFITQKKTHTQTHTHRKVTPVIKKQRQVWLLSYWNSCTGSAETLPFSLLYLICPVNSDINWHEIYLANREGRPSRVRSGGVDNHLHDTAHSEWRQVHRSEDNKDILSKMKLHQD